MIKGIAGGQGIQVNGAHTNFPFFNTNITGSGLVRYNGNNQTFEVYDGYNWQTVGSIYPTIELSSDIHDLLKWAKQKRDEEFRISELVEKYPMLDDAKKELDKSKSQFEMLVTLVKNHHQQE